jgi:hypothetical protein
VAAALILALSGFGIAAAQNSSYGIVTQVLPHGQALRVVGAGAGSVRLSLDWFRLETADNYYDPVYVSAIYEFLDRAKEHNLQVLLTIAYTPNWANGNRGQAYPPSDYQQWRQLLQVVFRELGDRPYITFEIWNEPDIDTFLLDNDYATIWNQLWFWANVARNDVGKPYIKLAGPGHSGYWPRMQFMSYALPFMIANGQPHDVISVHYYPSHPTSLDRLMRHIEDNYPSRDLWLTEAGSDQYDDQTQALELFDKILKPFAQRAPASRWKRVFIYQLTNTGNGMVLTNSILNPRLCLGVFRTAAAGNPVAYQNVTLQAASGHYVVAENGGGGEVNANRQFPGSWERFTLIDWNAGVLSHGDVVSLRAANYPNSPSTVFVRPPIPRYGFPGGVYAASDSYDSDAFFIYRAGGSGVISAGDMVYFRTITGHYFAAEYGGGGPLVADRSAVGPWELFRISK